MHARTDQLLSMRDGEPMDASVRRHVESCRECTAELAAHDAVRRLLSSVPPVESRPDTWERIRSRMAARGRAIRRTAAVSRAVAVAACVALIALALFASVEREGGSTPGHSTALAPTLPAGSTAAEVAVLRARSRALEQALEAMPSRPVVERADMSLPIDALEARVQWLDHRLSQSESGGISQGDAERLWRERVDVMNSLVRLRYVEAQRVAL